MSSLRFIIIILCIATSLVFAQPTPDSNTRLQELEKRYMEQEAILDSLNQQLQERMPQNYTEQIISEYQKKSDSFAQEDEEGISAGYDGGFFIRGSNNFELKMSGFLQMGVGIFENNTFDNNGMYTQGAWLMFDVNMFEKFHAHLELDFLDTGLYNQFQDGATMKIAVYDMYVEYNPIDEFNFIVGKIFVPFSMTGCHYYYANMTIWYEPFVNTGAPGSYPGAMIYGTFMDQLEYQLGVFNNAESMSTTDEKLYVATLRWYFLGSEKNPETFLHTSAMYTRYSSSPDVDSRFVTLYSGWGRQVFDGEDLNAHADKYGSAKANEALVRGRQWGFDLGLTWVHDFDNGSQFRVESEAMYMRYNRNLLTGKLAPLDLWGAMIAVSYRYPLCKTIENSGIIPTLAFSYTDIDNKHTTRPDFAGGPSSNIRGQRIWNYTIGLGYAFNEHLRINFNWVIMDLERNTTNPAKDNVKVHQDLEHAWFLQATATW